MLTFHPLKVADVHPEGSDALCISFEVPQPLREELHTAAIAVASKPSSFSASNSTRSISSSHPAFSVMLIWASAMRSTAKLRRQRSSSSGRR